MAEVTLSLLSSGHSLAVFATQRALAAPASASSTPTMWYVTRASAVAAYVLLTLSVALGTLQSIARRAGEHLTWIIDELHQFIATLAGLLVAVHVVSLVVDSYLPFSLSNVLLPLSEPYRPFAARLGVYALYGMALLLLSSWLRRRISHRLWRGIHYLSFVTVVLITAHGLLAGSDAQEVWMRGLYAAAAGGLGFAFVIRLFTHTSKPAGTSPDASRADERRLVRPEVR